MATHSSILAWRIPWMGETSGLQSTGPQRVGQNWVCITTKNYLLLKSYQARNRDKYPGDVATDQVHLASSTECALHNSAAAAKLLQSCPTLCDPIDGSPPGSPVPGILQARTLEWVAISFSKHESEKWKGSHSVVSDSSNPMDYSLPGSSIHGILQASTGVGCHCLLRFTTPATAMCVPCFSRVWLFVTLCTVAHQEPLSMGIPQARNLEWAAMPSSRGSFHPSHQTQVSYDSCIEGGFFYPLNHLGSPSHWYRL